jgi:hypothetical protein
MLVGMCLYQDWNNGDMGKTRLEMVKGFYDVTSTFKLSLPLRLWLAFAPLLASSQAAF